MAEPRPTSVGPVPGTGSSSGIISIDPDGMASAADDLGRAARSMSIARDHVDEAWKLNGEAFAGDPVGPLFDLFCETWVNGTNSVAELTQAGADYTQQIADLFGATDTVIAGGITQMYSDSDLPGNQPAYDPNAPVA